MKTRVVTSLALAAVAMCAFARGAEPPRHVAVTAQEPAGAALVERLRAGGLVMFFRHADTRGMPCDRSFRVGDREGQRNIPDAGRAQSQRIGDAMRALRIPVALPGLAGPVYRARDTAELAFGTKSGQVTDGLLADDYSGSRLLIPSRGAAGERAAFRSDVAVVERGHCFHRRIEQ